ncbi:Uncharacterized protein APZ42_016521 [Daphnia magna]|uniref:Uncharacterized protein n=1 Tax=Daphnia magna TaxID=35525 RepID=A0A165AGH1_9CRUS|nr:Uncharacterized protein APZ42_016521 [Daphnia magna]
MPCTTAAAIAINWMSIFPSEQRAAMRNIADHW